MNLHLLKALAVCTLTAGCTRVDTDTVRIVHDQQHIAAKAAFEAGLARELASTLGKVDFVCQSGAGFNGRYVIFCSEPDRKGLLDLYGWHSVVWINGFKGRPFPDNETFLIVETWYATYLPWMQSRSEFCKVSERVHRAVATVGAGRKVLSSKGAAQWKEQSTCD